jgi:probable F420-dependent oxidoreductase
LAADVSRDSRAPTYGLVLPHFGPHATSELLVRAAQAAERYGFDSVWVRDHVVFRPHEHERGEVDRTHIDPIVTLSYLASVTERLTLGTAAIIPHRHPIQLALILASLEHLAGPGRVIVGVGVGTYDHEFEAVGLGGIKRAGLLKENIEILRRLWTGEEIDHAGETYTFENVDIHPTPSSGGLPIWYCGGSRAAVRIAARHCDGWLPGRLPLGMLRKRMAYLHELCEEEGRPIPERGAMAIVSPAPTVSEGLSHVNVEGLLGEYRAFRDADPADGPEALDGALMAGPPEEILASTRRLHEAGVSNVVFDLRFRFDEWDDCLAILGETVLPELRKDER